MLSLRPALFSRDRDDAVMCKAGGVSLYPLCSAEPETQHQSHKHPAPCWCMQQGCRQAGMPGKAGAQTCAGSCIGAGFLVHHHHHLQQLERQLQQQLPGLQARLAPRAPGQLCTVPASLDQHLHIHSSQLTTNARSCLLM